MSKNSTDKLIDESFFVFCILLKNEHMTKENNFIDFYSGTEIAILGLQRELEAVGVTGIIQNDFRSGNLAGFVGGTADTVRFMIQESDLEKARPILEAYLKL